MKQQTCSNYPGPINWDIWISPRWHKVIHDFWYNKARIGLTLISVLVGVFALGTVFNVRSIMLRNVQLQFERSRQSSASISIRSFDDGLVDHVSSYPEVAAAFAMRTFNARIFNPGTSGAAISQKEWAQIRITALEDYNDIRLDMLETEAGVWPPVEKGLLVERSALNLIHAKIGDTVQVQTLNGLVRDMPIIGTVHDPAALPGEIMGFATGYIHYDTLEWLEQPRSFNTLLVLVQGDRQDKTHVSAMLDRITDRIEQDGWTVQSTTIPLYPGRPRLETNAKTITLILTIVGVMLVIISGIMVANTMEAIFTREIRQIGIMKVIGGQLSQILAIYLVFVFIISLVSFLLAAPLSVLASRAWMGMLTGLLNLTILDDAPPATTFYLQAAVAFLVVLLSSLKSIINATMAISAREALSSQGMEGNRLSKFDELLGRIRGVARPVILSIRNIFRKKWRLALTLFTLVLGGAVFVGIFHLHNSMSYTLNTLNHEFTRYDVLINFSQPYRFEQMENMVRQIDGVTYVEGWSDSSVYRIRPNGLESEEMQLIAAPAGSELIQPTVVKGRWLEPKDENAIVINKYVGDREPDIQVGDEIRLKIDGEESAWRIVGEVRSSVNFGQSPVLYANYEYFTHLGGKLGNVKSLQIVTAHHDGSSERLVADQLEALFSRKGINLRNVDTGANASAVLSKRVNIIGSVLSIVSLLLGIVGGINLTGTMSVNILERTREIGVMRAVGASSGDLLRITLSEGVFIGWISWLAAIPLSIPFGQALCARMGSAFVNFPFLFSFSFNGLVIWFGLVTLISILASIAPAQNAMRITVREAINYE